MHTIKGAPEHQPPVGICQHRIGIAICNAEVYMKQLTIPGLSDVKIPSIRDSGPPCLLMLSREPD